MSPPSADREDSAPLAAGETSDSEYEYEEIIEEVEEKEVVYEEVEEEEDEDEEEEEEEVEEEVEEDFEEEVEEEAEEEELEETDAGEEDVTEAKQNEGGGARDDLIQNLREEENDGHLISCSSTPGTCQFSLLSNAHLEQDMSQPGTSPSNLPSQRLDEKLTTSNEDPKSSISLEHQLSPKNCENQVPIEDKKDGELQIRAENPYFSNAVIQKSSISLEHQLSPKNCENQVPIEDKKDCELQLRAENPYFSDVVIQENSSYLHNGDAINAETSDSFHLSRNKRTISMTLDGHHGAEDNDARSSAKEVEQKDMECSEESEHMDSRFVDCGEASKNLTPIVELPERNKRAAIICDFFAKGWCIRGSSCRFVHAKGSADSSDQSPRGIGTSHCKKEDDNGEGQREVKLRLCTVMDTASVGGKTEFPSRLSSERILPSSGSPVDFHLSKCEDGFISRYGHAGRDRFSWSHHDDHRIHASSSDGVNSSVSELNLLPRYYQMPSSYGAIKELKGGGRSQFCNSPLQLPMRRSFNSSMHPSPFETSTTVSTNESLLGSNKRMKFTPYNWEPSVPFRPSFSLACLGITIPGIQYDPFPDIIEKPTAGDAAIRLASLAKTSEDQISGDMGRNHIPGSENDGHSGTSQSRVNEQVVSHSYGKDTCTIVAETAENSVFDCQNENVLLEESSSRPMDLGKNRSDQVSLKKASRDDRARSKIENKSMCNSDGDMKHEPKSVKHFRISLIELVKVLLRPIWNEGLLSKDEHNMIVKKAVDKVVSTVLLDQIPATKEATKQYLSLSQPKIAKLVEGYVEKYGKSCESRMKAPPPAVFEDTNVF